MKSRLSLAHGKNHHAVDILTTALGIGIEIAHGIQLVAEEFRSDRPVGGGGEYIQNAAPEGELTGALYHTASAVACLGELADQIIQRVLLPDLQGKGGSGQNRFGHGPEAEGFPGKNLHRGFSQGKIKKLPQPLLLPGAGDNSRVIKGQITTGKNGGGDAGKALQFLLETAGGHIVLADDHQRAAGVAVQSRNHVGAVDLSDAGDSGAFAAFDSIQQCGILRYGIQNRNKLFHILTSKVG